MDFLDERRERVVRLCACECESRLIVADLKINESNQTNLLRALIVAVNAADNEVTHRSTQFWFVARFRVSTDRNLLECRLE